MRLQNEEEYFADKVMFALCQICFPKLAFIGWEKTFNKKKMKKVEIFFKNEN